MDGYNIFNDELSYKIENDKIKIKNSNNEYVFTVNKIINNTINLFCLNDIQNECKENNIININNISNILCLFKIIFITNFKHDNNNLNIKHNNNDNDIIKINLNDINCLNLENIKTLSELNIKLYDLIKHGFVNENIIIFLNEKKEQLTNKN